MQRGKFPEISYKRTVLKKMSHISEGLKPGISAAPMNLEDVTVVMSSNCILKWFDGCEAFYLQKTINDLSEKGGIPKEIQLIINVPQKYDERLLGAKVQNLNDAANIKGIQISQCKVYKSETLELLVHITVFGTTKDELTSKNVKAGMDVVMAGATGIGGTVILNRLYRSVLEEKFSRGFLCECDEFEKMVSVEKAAITALKSEISFMHHVSDGGVFSAIWEIASSCNKGVLVDVKKIPIWQQTIELSEVFDINPYMMDGTGAILIVCENGKDVVKSLIEQNIPSDVIGKITDNNDKVIINGEEKRYLEPPREDELFNVRI